MTLLWFTLFNFFSVKAMTLDEYLSQVQQNNFAIQGAEKSVAAKKLRGSEAVIMFKPTFFFNAQNSDDKRQTNAPAFMGTQTIRRLYQAGISELFPTGTKVTLSFNSLHTEINGTNPQLLPRNKFYDLSPQLEISQSLWRNFLGAEDKNSSDMQRTQVQTLGLQDIFKKKEMLTRAENAFYRLALSQQALLVQKESLERAQKLRDWNQRRFNQGLADNTDFLQAEANLQMREIDLQTAESEVKSAVMAFNSVRQLDTDAPVLELSLDEKAWLDKRLPEKRGQREDVMAAGLQTKVVAHSSAMSLERNKPILEVYGNLSRNGRDESYSQAMTYARGNDYPYSIVGLRFVTSLDLGGLGDNKDSYLQEKVAAELGYKRKLYEAENEWKDLSQKFEDYKKRLSLNFKMEEIQRRKLASAKNLYSTGRTTTFQVLQFEQDFANAQLLKIRNLTELITVHNQLKLFSGDIYE